MTAVVLRELGVGAYGTVYLVQHGEARVAVKVYHHDEGHVWDILSQLRRMPHPHLLSILSLHPYQRYAMFEVAPYGTVSRAIRDVVPAAWTLQWCHDLAAAFQHLHRHGWHHGDATNANLFLFPAATPHDPPRLKLGDYDLCLHTPDMVILPLDNDVRPPEEWIGSAADMWFWGMLVGCLLAPPRSEYSRWTSYTAIARQLASTTWDAHWLRCALACLRDDPEHRPTANCAWEATLHHPPPRETQRQPVEVVGVPVASDEMHHWLRRLKMPSRRGSLAPIDAPWGRDPSTWMLETVWPRTYPNSPRLEYTVPDDEEVRRYLRVAYLDDERAGPAQSEIVLRGEPRSRRALEVRSAYRPASLRLCWTAVEELWPVYSTWHRDPDRLVSLLMDQYRCFSLPNLVRDFRNLRVLGMQRCNVMHLPDTLSECTSLEQVDVSINWLRTLFPMAGLQRLTALNIGKNAIEAVEEEVASLPRLELVDAQHNRLTSFPTHPWPSLTYLNLSYNLIDRESIRIPSLTNFLCA